MAASHAVFHPLAVAAVEPVTEDAVAITFDVPAELREDYAFSHGQHLTIRTALAGDDVRRNYSICSPAGSGVLRVAVKRLPGSAHGTRTCFTPCSEQEQRGTSAAKMVSNWQVSRWRQRLGWVS